jgi:VWFA-related protein
MPLASQGQIDQAQTTSALQTRAAAQPQGLNESLTLDVVVTDKSGHPVSGLHSEDFKLLDNKQPQSLVSFQAAGGASTQADPPVEVILLFDANDTPPVVLDAARAKLAAFFQANGGVLALPTSFLFLTDHGTPLKNEPTRNGKTLLKILNDHTTGVSSVDHKISQGFSGELEREQRSWSALHQLAFMESNRPGRKLLLWIGEGWPSFPEEDSFRSKKDDRALFSIIVSLSTELREDRITLYSIDPRGVSTESGNDFTYKNYLKGVSAPERVQYGDLDLQVLAIQSGGKVLFGSNDLATLIDQCVADASAYYVLSFKPAVAAHPDEYHDLSIQIDKPGLKARTRTSYYAQP